MAGMNITEYFDVGHAVGSLRDTHYTICECKVCGSLVVMNKKAKHASWHELQSALLHQLVEAAKR